MQNARTTKTLLIAALLLIAGTTFAYAQRGWSDDDDYGCGRSMHGYHGRMMGPDHGGPMGYGRGFGPGAGNLTEEEATKVKAARDKFFDETRTLRRDIDDKAYDLNKAIDSETPDAAKVSALQKELSALQAQFDQKRVAHQLEMRKLLPEKFRSRGGYCWRN